MAGTQTPGSNLPDTTFKVDFAVMREAVAHIQAASTQLNQLLNDHVTGQAPLYSTWSGSARDHQFTKHGQWLYAAWTMADVVKRTGDALDQISQNYEKQEGGFEQMWAPAKKK